MAKRVKKQRRVTAEILNKLVVYLLHPLVIAIVVTALLLNQKSDDKTIYEIIITFLGKPFERFKDKQTQVVAFLILASPLVLKLRRLTISNLVTVAFLLVPVYFLAFVAGVKSWEVFVGAPCIHLILTLTNPPQRLILLIVVAVLAWISYSSR